MALLLAAAQSGRAWCERDAVRRARTCWGPVAAVGAAAADLRRLSQWCAVVVRAGLETFGLVHEHEFGDNFASKIGWISQLGGHSNQEYLC